MTNPEAIVRDHHITLKASLQNAQEQKRLMMEQFHQWAGAEAMLLGLLKDLEERINKPEEEENGSN